MAEDTIPSDYPLEKLLATYLGDSPDYRCGNCRNCRPDLFPIIDATERIQKAVKVFEDEWLPCIEKKGKTLSQAGAICVYPLTITRTMHSDDL